MAKTVYYLLIAGLVYTNYVACSTTGASTQTTSVTTQDNSQTSPTQTTSETRLDNSQTSPTQTTQASTQTTTPESILDFIQRAINDGIQKGMKQLLDAVASAKQGSTPASPTTAPSTASQTTATTESTISGKMAAACPDGQYDEASDTVTFTLEGKECQITVYLSKPPKGKKAKKPKKEKKAKKGKNEKNEQVQEQGQRFIKKEIAVGPIPGREFDQCQEVVARKFGKDNFFLQTSECIMYVQIPKGKGKDRSTRPIIMTERARQ